MTSRPKVLVTGASGLLGGLAIRNLSDKYEFSGLSRSRTADFAHTKSPPRPGRERPLDPGRYQRFRLHCLGL